MVSLQAHSSLMTRKVLMRNGRYLHYFDACVFLHWLADDPKDAVLIAGIEDTILAAEKHGTAIIVTSTITRIEVLQRKMTADAADRFAQMLRQFTIQSANVDPLVAELAHEIRNHYHSRTPPIKLETPDCIHLATAIAYECDEMNTLDGAGCRKRPADLISLSENVIDGKYKIRITPPARKPRAARLWEPAGGTSDGDESE